VQARRSEDVDVHRVVEKTGSFRDGFMLAEQLDNDGLLDARSATYLRPERVAV
jgi:hypothetical protein